MSDDIRKKFWTQLADSPFVMIGLESDGGHSAPMSAQLDKSADGHFWFFTSKDSRISAGGKAMAQLASKGHDLFACIGGILVEETDSAVIDGLWSNPIEAWYEHGRNDPKLLVLRFELANAEVWTAEMGMVGIFKMMTGMTMNEDEMGEHAILEF